MDKDILNIDLSKYRGINSTSFTGRPQGKQVRKELKLDKIESNYNLVYIHIPLGTTSFNPSFFLGLFYNSIKTLKSVTSFKDKYIFNFDDNESETLKELILENIEEALEYAKNSLEDSKKGFRF